jgi:hypothetical protein
MKILSLMILSGAPPHPSSQSYRMSRTPNLGSRPAQSITLSRARRPNAAGWVLSLTFHPPTPRVSAVDVDASCFPFLYMFTWCSGWYRKQSSLVVISCFCAFNNAGLMRNVFSVNSQNPVGANRDAVSRRHRRRGCTPALSSSELVNAHRRSPREKQRARSVERSSSGVCQNVVGLSGNTAYAWPSCVAVDGTLDGISCIGCSVRWVCDVGLLC